MSGATVLLRAAFDPIGKGHLQFARAASLRLGADVVFSPIYEGKEPMNVRAEMLGLMIKKENTYGFSLDYFEAKSRGTSGVLDTLRHIALIRRGQKIYLPLSGEDFAALGKETLRQITALATILYVPGKNDQVDDALLAESKAVRFPYGRIGSAYEDDLRNLRLMELPSYIRETIENKGLYFISVLGKHMSTKRLLHSISVANLAYYIALGSKVEMAEKAYVAGLIHDIAKHLAPDQAKLQLEKHMPEALAFPAWTYHQFLAPFIAEEVFGINDADITTAIVYHATGKAHMTPLAKIIYSADKIEPTRGFDSSSLISACLKDYYVGFLEVLAANREYLLSNGYQIDNPLTKNCFEIYLGGSHA
ncbi:MAG: bis(5'-nucleosyl)-tetraphosphatase (symmetrical) YqeK [Bacilli bacterium]|nr:bis(5'-nucleosyl)-tetraphosphatase (symmetrical) YqeK [Bacilli bacterium]